MREYFKTVDQQIDILRSRKLIIDDVEEAKKSLLFYNYYKLINGTYKYFAKDYNPEKKEEYIEGTYFDDLVDVHDFDKDLKKILLSASLEIERIARSIISYKFMEKHPQHGAYLDPRSYSNQNIPQVKANIASVEETIQNFLEEENYNRSMSYYKRKYDSIPFWFIVNFISFGKLVNLYETMDFELKEDIADQFQFFVEENLGRKLDEYLTPSHLQSFLQNAKEIRNLTAHDNLILDHKFTEIEFFKSIHDNYALESIDERKKLFASYLTLQALLPVKQYKELEEQVRAAIDSLKENIDENAYKKIIKSIGFDKWR